MAVHEGDCHEWVDISMFACEKKTRLCAQCGLAEIEKIGTAFTHDWIDDNWEITAP